MEKLIEFILENQGKVDWEFTDCPNDFPFKRVELEEMDQAELENWKWIIEDESYKQDLEYNEEVIKHGRAE